MALPLTWYRDVRAFTPEYSYIIQGYRQRKPFNINTDMTSMRTFGRNTDGRSWAWGVADGLILMDNKVDQQVTNKAYAKLVSKIGDQSSFGATLTAERKQTLGMLTGTVLRLVSAARKIRRFDFRGAARELGLPDIKERTVKRQIGRSREAGSRKRGKRVYRRVRVFTLPTGREVSKTLANGWLLYSYGIKPLAQDIYNGLDVLRRPFPEELIKGSASATRSKSGNIETSRDRETGRWFNYFTQYSGTVRVSCGAVIQVNNPDVFTLNQMGLTNPVQWANEAIPFSFVVDWFSNLSQVISSLTDFVGLNVSRTWTSRSTDCREQLVSGFAPMNSQKRVIYYNRSTSLPSPKLVFAYERFSWQRGLNAISLLIGFLPRR